MAFSITVKNTFLVLESSASDRPLRRSTSVPRSLKLGVKMRAACKDDDDFHSARGDDSTWSSVSDLDTIDNLPTSDGDSQEHREDLSDDHFDYPDYRTDYSEEDRGYMGEFTEAEVCQPCLFEACLFEVPESTSQNVSIPSDSVLADREEAWRSQCKSKISLCDMVLEDPPPPPPLENRVALSLDAMVHQGAAKARMKLRSQAKPFKSVREPTADTKAVLENAVEVMDSMPDVLDVEVRHGGMGGTTVVMAKSTSANPDPSLVFSLVKDALLHAAEESENTYILGYGAQPFTNIDALSFSCNIVCAPLAQADTTCWDTYSEGYCPRCSACRWNHPSDIDKMHVIVMITKAM
jgi:hypothetical protein